MLIEGGERLADRSAIAQLLAAYALTVDDRDIAGITACYTDDGVFQSFDDGTRVEGHTAIAAFYAEAFTRPMLASGVSTHVMTNTVVTFTGPDEASARTQAIAFLAATAGSSDASESSESSEGAIVARGLTYADRLARTANGWRLRERVHRLHWQGRFPGGPAHA